MDKEDGCQMTALRLAVIDGNSGIVKILLRVGSNVNKPDHFGCTALHRAVADGNFELVEILINVSEVDKQDRFGQDQFGQTVLDLAERYRIDAVVEILLKAGGGDME